MSNGHKFQLGKSSSWNETAIAVCRFPLSSVKCPMCLTSAVSGEWSLLSVKSRKTSVDLYCKACDARESVQIELPIGAAPCYPFARFPFVIKAIKKEIESLAASMRQHTKTMPAAAFAIHPLWSEAKWSATTYKFHPAGEVPPIMGLVFENVEAGLEIFREAEQQMHHDDQLDEIRVTIIEGTVPGQEDRPGYSVHICADPDALEAHATMEDLVVDPSVIPFLGQWNRHYPVPGAPLLLARFKDEFEKHKEFLLAPAVYHADGKLYIEPTLGIVKNTVNFRQLSDITTPDDIDAAALMLPQFIVPPI
jgi:hypothetical protein